MPKNEETRDGVTIRDGTDTKTVTFEIPADADVDAVRAACRPYVDSPPNVVGNFADLQRLGALKVTKTGGDNEAFVPPPDTTVEELKDAGVGDAVTTTKS